MFLLLPLSLLMLAQHFTVSTDNNHLCNLSSNVCSHRVLRGLYRGRIHHSWLERGSQVHWYLLFSERLVNWTKEGHPPPSFVKSYDIRAH